MTILPQQAHVCPKRQTPEDKISKKRGALCMKSNAFWQRLFRCAIALLALCLFLLPAAAADSTVLLQKSGTPVQTIPVWDCRATDTVLLVCAEDLFVTLPSADAPVRYEVHLQADHLVAPVRAHTQAGVLQAYSGQTLLGEVPLITNVPLARSGGLAFLRILRTVLLAPVTLVGYAVVLGLWILRLRKRARQSALHARRALCEDTDLSAPPPSDHSENP